VNDFRESHSIDEGWGICTEIVSITEDECVVMAHVIDPAGRVVGCGFAQESRASSKINKTSMLENGETSAIGRALASCGYGGTQYASANEVQIAVARQEQEEAKPAHRWSERERQAFCAALTERGYRYGAVAEWCERMGKPRPSAMTAARREKVLTYLRGGDRHAEIEKAGT